MSLIAAYELVELIKELGGSTGLSTTYSEQDNSYVRQWALKAPDIDRTYCYVLFEDKRRHNAPANLVFRFRADATPASWFAARTVPPMATDWARRFHLMWDDSRGVPSGCADEGHATKQFGVLVSRDDVRRPEIKETLRCFLEIAAESVAQARLHATRRNWSAFARLVA